MPSSRRSLRPRRTAARSPVCSPRAPRSPSPRPWPEFDLSRPSPPARPRMATVPVAMGRKRFEELVSEALDEVPEELLDLMDNVVILVEDEPEGDDPALLGVYEGFDLTSRGWDYSGVLP